MVLVQERSAAATGPVVQLGRHLVGEGLLAVLAIALTVAALWFIVLRGRAARRAPIGRRPPNRRRRWIRARCAIAARCRRAGRDRG